MKRIVRLTESDLTRIVRRVLSEGVGTSAADEFVAALSGTFDDDEAGALTAIRKCKNRNDLVEFSKRIQGKTGKGWCEYFNSEMSDVDEEYGQINDYVKSIGGSDCFNYSYAGHMRKSLSNTFGSGGGGGSRRY
jgi:hypothetical protein